MQEPRYKITTAYYLHLGHTLQCKNKLEKELLELFQELDAMLIQIEDMPKFRATLSMKITEISNKHLRCKVPGWYIYDSLHDVKVIHNIDFAKVFLYPVTQNFIK
jgi:hypothetical protein